QRIPAAAEAGRSFAGRLAGLRVLDEAVERMAGIGDLEVAVATPCRPEQVGAGAAPGNRLSPSKQRRPVPGTVAVARALLAFVVSPEVERPPVRIDEDPA